MSKLVALIFEASDDVAEGILEHADRLLALPAESRTRLDYLSFRGPLSLLMAAKGDDLSGIVGSIDHVAKL